MTLAHLATNKDPTRFAILWVTRVPGDSMIRLDIDLDAFILDPLTAGSDTHRLIQVVSVFVRDATWWSERCNRYGSPYYAEVKYPARCRTQVWTCVDEAKCRKVFAGIAEDGFQISTRDDFTAKWFDSLSAKIVPLRLVSAGPNSSIPLPQAESRGSLMELADLLEDLSESIASVAKWIGDHEGDEQYQSALHALESGHEQLYTLAALTEK
jgi:hypothetical protein